MNPTAKWLRIDDMSPSFGINLSSVGHVNDHTIRNNLERIIPMALPFEAHVFPMRPLHPKAKALLLLLAFCTDTDDSDGIFGKVLEALPRTSDNDPSQLAFLTDPKNPNRWTTMKPNRWARRMMEELGLSVDDEIVERMDDFINGENGWATVDAIRKRLAHQQLSSESILHELSAAYALHEITEDNAADLATDCDMLTRSCMTHDLKDVEVHPWSIYEPQFGWRLATRSPIASDLAPLGDEGYSLAQDCLGGKSRIAARALVNIQSKCYVRVYGAITANSDTYASAGDRLLERWLKHEGFHKKDAWPEGLQLGRYEQNGYFVVPYLDGELKNFDDTGCVLVIRSRGRCCADSSDGLVEMDNRVDTTEGRYDEGDTVELNYRRPNGRWYEARHYDQSYAIVRCDEGSMYDEWILYEDSTRLEDDHIVLSSDAVETVDDGLQLRSDCTNFDDDRWCLDEDIITLHDGDEWYRRECVKLAEGGWAKEEDAFQWEDGSYHLEDESEPVEKGA